MTKKLNLLMSVPAMLAVMTFASCSQTDMVDTAGSPTTRSVTFNIQLPNGDPVRYTTRADVQEEAERSFNSLKILPYDATTDKGLAPTADIHSSLTDANWDGNNYKWTYTEAAPSAETPIRRFVFVGNDACSDTNIGVDKDYSDLSSAKCATQITASTALSSIFTGGYLPMTGIAKQVGGTQLISLSTTLNTDINVQMTRCVARIDIVNKTPNLVIEELTLDNVCPTGYLMPHTPLASTGDTKVNGVGLFSTATLSNVKGISADDFTAATASGASAEAVAKLTAATLKQAFYVYEDAAGLSENILTLNVKGKISGTPVFYSIPFVDKLIDGHSGTTSIAIERNHLYTLTLGDGSSVASNTSLSSTIQKANWESDESVTGELEASMFTATVAMTGENPTPGYSYESSVQKIIIPAAQLSGTDVTIQVTDGYYQSGSGVTITGVEVMDGDNWTAAASEGNPATGSWLTATFTDTQKVTITTSSANTSTTEDRVGQIRVSYQYTDTSSQVQNKKIVFSVTQSKANS